MKGDHYFPFYILNEWQSQIEHGLLLAIILGLVYWWIKLFLWFDKNSS